MARSLESALEEERKEIMAMLEQQMGQLAYPRSSTSSSGSLRASSPSLPSPFSPVRSRIEIDDEEWEPKESRPRPPRKAVRSPPLRPRHMLDLDDEEWEPKESRPRPPQKAVRSPPLRPRHMLDLDDEEWEPKQSRPRAVQTELPTPPPPIHMRSNLLDMDDDDWEPKPPRSRLQSMLDINTTSSPLTLSRSAQSSPTNEKHMVSRDGERTTSYIPYTRHAQHRSFSDASSKPAGFGPRSRSIGANPEHMFQFSGYLSSHPGGHFGPKRNTLVRKTSVGAMAEVVRGGDLNFFGTRERGRNHSIAGTGIGASRSRSPHHRLYPRSNSPSLMASPSHFQLDDGRIIDMNSAYRRLSDANLSMSRSSLSKKAARRRNQNGENYPTEGARLEKDSSTIDGELAVESSDDEKRSSDADDDEKPRGRKKNARAEEKGDGPENQTNGTGKEGKPRTALSMLAAAEEERIEVATKYKVRPPTDPEITVTTPSGLRVVRPMKSSSSIHPNTSFDEGASGFNTSYDSDTEAEYSDIYRAQKLSINMTPIVSTPATNRSVRTIYRGDFRKMQIEARDNQRRVRKYLVATDLSDEAAHALEWTIGTVLRDGDTLLAIYCVDEQLGIVPNDASGDDQKMAVQVQAIAAAAKSSVSTPILAAAPIPSPLGPGFRLDSSSTSVSPVGRERGQAEPERYRAVQDITDRVSRLLRKTKLQVKVVIEVIHCKSPRHLITEVIDYINPTLVILGSRGRSALKGRVVILGSFSNYLVTKSSVPVMVARKRLRKHSKYRRPAIRLANNLANPVVRSLASAKID